MVNDIAAIAAAHTNLSGSTFFQDIHVFESPVKISAAFTLIQTHLLPSTIDIGPPDSLYRESREAEIQMLTHQGRLVEGLSKVFEVLKGC